MKIIALRGTPCLPPVETVVLELSPQEFHDLQVVAAIPQDVLTKLLKSSTHPWVNEDCNFQTYGVFGLMKRIAEVKL